ncbi:MAG: hypothetical protein ABI333_17415 [bacterium]
MSKLGVALSVLLLVAGFHSSAQAQTSAKDQARKHFAKGFAYYQNGEFLKAVRELRIAYKIRPVPVVLFYIGKTFQGAGLNDEAVRAFCKFLDESTLNNNKRAQATASLKQMNKTCQAEAAGIGEPGGAGTPDVRPRERPREVPAAVGRRRPRVKPGEIIHEPIEDARPSRPLTMEAELPEDFGDWARLYLYYRPKGSEKFIKKMMKADRRSIYHGCIPRRHMIGSSIQYFIEAVGRTGKRKAGSGTSASPNIVGLSESNPLQPGGRLKGCPDEVVGGGAVEPDRPGGTTPGGVTPGGVTPLPGGEQPQSKRKLKLIGFIATAAAAVAAFVTGGLLAKFARDKAQEMANAGNRPPQDLLFYDGNVETIEKQGKALQTGMAVSFVLGSIAAAGAIYLGLDVFLFSKKKTESPTKITDTLHIAPTFGPRGAGVTGGFRF